MRLPVAPERYSKDDEQAFRRRVEQELARESVEIRLGGGLLYEDSTNGKLTYKGRNGTITVLALP